VSETVFERSIRLAVPPARVAAWLGDSEAWFRLNPEWEVLAFDRGARTLRVRYDRSEAEAGYRVGGADFSGRGGVIALEGDEPRRLEIELAEDGHGTLLSYREAFAVPLEAERRAELNLWQDATAGYLRLLARSDRRARLWLWLLDRFWLRLSPTARRVSLLIIAMEALALLLFVAILLVAKLF
jgi:hypothetical protein